MPGGIVTRSVRLRSVRPSPWHVWHGRLDDLALALAARAGADVDHLAEHRLADAADLAAAVALGAGDRLVPGSAPLPSQVSQRCEDAELDLLLGALDRLLERDPQVVAQVRAGLRPAAPGGAAARPATEERVEDVREPAEALEAAPDRPGRRRRRPARTCRSAGRRCGSDRTW